ncbi:hypothetical protein D3C81_1031430 [compost metagenome]
MRPQVGAEQRERHPDQRHFPDHLAVGQEVANGRQRAEGADQFFLTKGHLGRHAYQQKTRYQKQPAAAGNTVDETCNERDRPQHQDRQQPVFRPESA